MDDKYLELLEKQNKMTKIIAVLMGIICAVVVISAITIVPRVNRTLREAQQAIEAMNEIADSLDVEELGGLITDTHEFVNTSNEELADAMERVESIDIDTLNRAIQDLEAIVEPIARMMGK